MQEQTKDKTNEAPPRSNDAIIGQAFRWSVLAFLVIVAAGIGGTYLWKHFHSTPDVIVEARVAGPKQVAQHTVAAPPLVHFTDITRQAGITFSHNNGAYGEKLLPETMGGGVAFLDFDNDGDQDLLFVNSRNWPERQADETVQPTLALYANDGQGGFLDVTTATGTHISLYGMGVAAGDYDNDGFVDLFITAVGANRLLHNQAGVFHDVTETAGVAGADDAWSTSAAFIDYDNDGDLDLFVANYVRWSRDIDLEIDFRLTGIGRAYGPPTTFAGSYPYLYRNDGAGHFTDVSAGAGVQINNPATGLPMAKALAVAVIDIDQDGWLDIFVANDTVQNFFFHNQGDGTFAEDGVARGLAFDRNGSATGAMGTDAAYYRNTADLGLAIGNFANEMTSLYVSQGDTMQFADEAITDGLASATRRVLSFGLFFFDYDLDGRLDLLQANGHLEDSINLVQPSQHYAQPAQLFWNCGPDCISTFIEASDSTTGDLAKPMVGRGASFADIDHDGDLDVVITQTGGQPLLLRNDQELGHHWLRIKLIGHQTNRDSIGAVVELKAGNVVQKRQVMPTRSYLSQTELPLTFGLGNLTAVDHLRVQWPDRSVQNIDNVAMDSLMIIEQRPAGISQAGH